MQPACIGTGGLFLPWCIDAFLFRRISQV